MFQFTPGSTATREEIAESLRKAPPIKLMEFIEELGLRISDLTESNLKLLIVARNSKDLVDTFHLPVAKEKTELELLSEIKLPHKDSPTNLGYAKTDSDVPSDDFEIARAQGPEDLPLLIPEQFLLPDNLFFKELAEGSLLKFVPLDDDPYLRDEDAPQVSLDKGGSSSTHETVHGIGLLDTSLSMVGSYEDRAQEPDPRSQIARGIMLAFLHRALTHHYYAHLKPFSDREFQTVSIDARDRAETSKRFFIELTTLPNLGSTLLQKSLEETVREIKEKGEFKGANILLITDGMARLKENPLGDIKLHTILVGRFNPKKGSEEEAWMGKLSSWSSVFHNVMISEESELLKITNDDIISLSRAILPEVSKELPFADNPLDCVTLQDQLNVIKEALKTFRNQGEELTDDAKEIQAEVESLEGLVTNKENEFEHSDLGGPRSSQNRNPNGDSDRYGLSQNTSLSEMLRAIAREIASIPRKLYSLVDRRR